MITGSDVMIVVGVGVSLVGCWLSSVETGLIGTGVVICLAGRVLYGINGKGRKK